MTGERLQLKRLRLRMTIGERRLLSTSNLQRKIGVSHQQSTISLQRRIGVSRLRRRQLLLKRTGERLPQSLRRLLLKKTGDSLQRKKCRQPATIGERHQPSRSTGMSMSMSMSTSTTLLPKIGVRRLPRRPLLQLRIGASRPRKSSHLPKKIGVIPKHLLLKLQLKIGVSRQRKSSHHLKKIGASLLLKNSLLLKRNGDSRSNLLARIGVKRLPLMAVLRVSSAKPSMISSPKILTT